MPRAMRRHLPLALVAALVLPASAQGAASCSNNDEKW